MAPSAISTELPPASAISKTLETSKSDPKTSFHPLYLQNLALTILHDLLHQHEWTSLKVHTHSSLTSFPLPRPIISGLPPRRAYIHPDEQVEILKAEHKSGTRSEQEPEREWVLPTQIQEKWTLKRFVEVFDALDVVPKGELDDDDDDEVDEEVGYQWRGKNRQKRLLLATVHDDSTVVYYIMHDGIVKPRQN